MLEIVSELVKAVVRAVLAEALKLLVDALKERAEQQRASEAPGGKGKHFKKP